MALTIPAHELDVCMRLARPGYEAISLINDIYSWPKERAEAEKAGQDYVFNAVWVVMKERKCDEQKATEFCKNLARQSIQDFSTSGNFFQHHWLDGGKKLTKKAIGESVMQSIAEVVQKSLWEGRDNLVINQTAEALAE
ncbi:hypothetical protein SLS59_009184 [Nothophoma quercina]|uniref:Uncharacterized protein n=1 Tax=Nothophoma quercina TaxID=749835 RepID=A0ABR3QNH8_9PLEO